MISWISWGFSFLVYAFLLALHAFCQKGVYFTHSKYFRAGNIILNFSRMIQTSLTLKWLDIFATGGM